MTVYMLDTNTVIALLNNTKPMVVARASEAIGRGETLQISSIVAHELWYGVYKSGQQTRNAAALERFLTGMIGVVPFDVSDGARAGEIRAQLRRTGTPIGAYDVLIAGHALELGATLVTNNTQEFKRVAGLALEDWTY